MAPKGEEKAMDELVQESPQEDEITELQVPRLVQFPGTAEPAHSHSKPDEVFNFWSRQSGNGFQLPGGRCATAAPPDFSGCITAAITLHCWQPKRTDVSTSEALLPLILQLAVQLNGCAWEGLCSLKSLPL